MPFILIALLCVSCLEPQSEDVDAHPSGVEDCERCHHGSDAEELTRCDGCHPAIPTSGAHTAHLEGGEFEKRYACVECHVVPGSWFDKGHLNGVVELVFDEDRLAATEGEDEPSWDGIACADVYCHGASLSGGVRTEPEWDDDEDVECGDCHGIPPPEDHPPGDNCSPCHAIAFDEEGEQRWELHIDGFMHLLDERDDD